MKHFKSCAKSDMSVGGDGGRVAGYASTFDRVPDSYGDVVAPGAFSRSLERWGELNSQGKYIPLLYGHNTDDPEYNIGRVVVAREDDRGLYVEAEFDPDNGKAQYVRKLAQEGRLYQFSFAFSVEDQGEVELEGGAKANELRELELYEVSLVQIPANQRATVEGVKAGRRNSAKDEGDLMDAREKAQEIVEIIDGLVAVDDSGQSEREGEDGKSEGRGRQAEMLEIYKEAVKAAYAN